MSIKGEHARELGASVKARRMELGISRPADLAEKMGVVAETVRMIERSQRASYDEGTLLALDRSLGWALGSSARTLVTGDAPTVMREASEDRESVDPMLIDVQGDILKGLTPSELAEVRAAATASGLARIREIRSSRGGGDTS